MRPLASHHPRISPYESSCAGAIERQDARHFLGGLADAALDIGDQHADRQVFEQQGELLAPANGVPEA
jgi:hypothetical protein